MPDSPLSNDLSLSSEQMRDIGYEVIDAIVEQFQSVGKGPAISKRTRRDMHELLHEPVPAAPSDASAVLKRVTDEIFGNFAPLDHPRFFAFVPGPINFISVMAEALAAAHNPFMGSWLVSSGPTQIELTVIDWLRQMCGLPETAGGLFVSGGSIANLSAIAAARHVKLAGDMTGSVIYCSRETHSSIDRAINVLGFKPEQLRHIDTDVGFRVDVDELERAIETDRTAGLRPFMIIANAGTTNTGAIDPLETIADLCQSNDLWFHVDGAYGAPTMLTDKGKTLLAGIERADSITLDPHKWLFQPYEIGCLLLRDRTLLIDTFHIFKDYMQDVIGEAEEVNLRDYGIQLTRNFRALKLWMSIQVFGMDAFRGAVKHGLRMAEFAGELLQSPERKDRWEIITPPDLGIITFRYLPEAMTDEKAIDAFNLKLIDAMYADGYAMVSSTTLHNRPVLRLCPINPRTTEDDIRGTIERFETMADR
ncbi:MAG: aminotransferase class I/II-fold pyridoxal phosphate-dependent enzyme [Planctomycetes bacterium]|nr:aminotransferase class I/II-fold pyridoxal phosphate-dependent enzyme [Planctomycetota bacterium]